LQNDNRADNRGLVEYRHLANPNTSAVVE